MIVGGLSTNAYLQRNSRENPLLTQNFKVNTRNWDTNTHHNIISDIIEKTALQMHQIAFGGSSAIILTAVQSKAQAKGLANFHIYSYFPNGHELANASENFCVYQYIMIRRRKIRKKSRMIDPYIQRTWKFNGENHLYCPYTVSSRRLIHISILSV